MLDQLLFSTKKKTSEVLNYLRKELASIRTSRATPALIEDLPVEAYEGQPAMALKELAAISAPDPQTLLVSPWDASVVPRIEKAIRESPLGLNPATFDVNIRVPIPALTKERRHEFIKLVRHQCEEAKIAVRNVRHEKMKSLDEQKEAGVISQDEQERLKKELEEHFEGVNRQIDEIRKNKEEELKKV